MSERPVARDERTVVVENSSFRWAYLFLTYGLLSIAAYRGLVRSEQSWDLLALVVASGAVTTLYQGRQRVLTRVWLMVSLSTLAAALLLAATIVVLKT